MLPHVPLGLKQFMQGAGYKSQSRLPPMPSIPCERGFHATQSDRSPPREEGREVNANQEKACDFFSPVDTDVLAYSDTLGISHK